jgi:hypothetical protein
MLPPGGEHDDLIRRARQTEAASSADPEISGRLFSSIADDVVADLRTLIEAAQTGPLDRRYVNKHILAAGIWLNEPITLGWIEPLHYP